MDNCYKYKERLEDKITALSLVNEYYRHKMELITNGVVIDDALNRSELKVCH